MIAKYPIAPEVAGFGSSVLYGAHSASAVPEFTAGRATLAIHDASGRRIATLIDREVDAGWTTVRWDGRDEAGRRQASGVYFASVKTETGREVQKITLVK
jgi:flagellar hook assembly protein FlgD